MVVVMRAWSGADASTRSTKCGARNGSSRRLVAVTLSPAIRSLRERLGYARRHRCARGMRACAISDGSALASGLRLLGFCGITARVSASGNEILRQGLPKDTILAAPNA